MDSIEIGFLIFLHSIIILVSVYAGYRIACWKIEPEEVVHFKEQPKPFPSIMSIFKSDEEQSKTVVDKEDEAKRHAFYD